MKINKDLIAEFAYDPEFEKKYPSLTRLDLLNILQLLKDMLEDKKSRMKQVSNEVVDLETRINALTKELLNHELDKER